MAPRIGTHRRRSFLSGLAKRWSHALLSRERRARSASEHQSSPGLECLERRVQLSTVTWVTQASGDWDTASNWSTGKLPGAGDDVVIPALPSGDVVTHSTGSDTVHSVSSSAPITLSGGTLTVKTQVQISGGANLQLAGGTLSGATVASGSVITLTNAGGVLDAVTIASGAMIDGTEPTTSNLDQIGITNSLTLDGTMELGNSSGSIAGEVLFNRAGSPQAQTLAGDGTVLYGGSSSNAIVANGYSFEFEIFPCILTIASGITIHGGTVNFHGTWQGDTTILEGTVISNTAGGTVNVHLVSGNSGVVDGFQSITAANGGGVVIPGSLEVDSPSAITVAPGSSLSVNTNLLGSTETPADFDPAGTVTLNGSGTSSSPQLLEAMSADLGNVASAFANNFAYGKLVVSPNDYVKLVNQSVNSPSSAAEAVYAGSLVVPSGGTLNLNGLNLYVRDEQVSGTITGGTITQIPDGGALPLDTPTPGAISTAGQADNWTFFGRAGASIDLALDPGSDALDGPVLPALGMAEVELLDSSNNVVASATSTTAGAVLALNNVVLPSDGTYTVVVQAAPTPASGTGNYVVSVYDVTTRVQSLSIGQTTSGLLATPFSSDEWTFATAANAQIQFNFLAESATGLNFSLTGPDGFVGFSKIAGGSSLVTLPADGTYTLTAQGTGASTGSFSFSVTETPQATLTLGSTYNGAFAASGEPQVFVVNVPSPAPLSLRLIDSSSLDHVEMYASLGAPPTRGSYQYGANGSGALQSLVIPAAPAGTWYILVYAESVVVPTSSFTLLASASPVVVSTVTPATYSANAVATLTLTGAGFATNSTVALVAADGTTTYPASSVTFDTFTQLTATLNLAGVPQGTYSIQVTDGAVGSSRLPSAFTVTAPGEANLVTRLILPSAVGFHISSTFYVQYANTGSAAMPAPLLLLESTVADDVPLFTLNQSLVVPGFWTSAIPQGYSNTVEILASGKTPGVLEPGESVTVPVYYAGMQQPYNTSESQFNFDIRVFSPSDTDKVDWAPLQSQLQPASIPSAAWSTIYSSLVSQFVKLGPPTVALAQELTEVPIGPLTPEEIQLRNDYAAGFVASWGGYVALLDEEASYLGSLGEDVTDVNSLWGFAVQQADNSLNPLGPDLASATDDSVDMPGTLSLSFSRVYSSTISGRDEMGPLGLGWSTPWQSTASVGPDGTVTITGAAGAQRVFQPDSRTAGAYFSQPGDTGTLKSDSRGGYLLTEADGTVTDYNANGALNYIADTNGNRITAGYTGSQLTSLTGTTGQFIDIAYNPAGLISSVTDSTGRTTAYAYDSTNQYLVSVTGYNGQTTSYGYNTSVTSPSFNALTTISFPSGTHQYFTYDSEGRLSGTSNDGVAQPQTFGYALGEVSVTDGTGDKSSLYYTELGLVVKSTDALGNVTINNYDANFNLVKVTNAVGESESYTYNAAGEVTSSTDFLGNTTYFAYSGPFNDLTSMTDAKGNTTTYAYSTAGDLLSTTYADGTSSSSTYDPEGDALSFLNQNGQPISYTYNAAGQVLTEKFSDGSQYTYTYDAHGNMVNAKDSTGTTTFSYDSTTELLTEVAYPNGLYLKFTYNAAGQRTSIVDQTGFTTDYVYDTVGRLSQLTDGSGNVIVTYTYDPDGRLGEKVNGNGTYTTYQYDADGNVLHLINFAPDGSVNSRFDYTYDSLGLETTEATLDGTWTYSYDADGQLVHAVFASTNSSEPSQDLAYTYDAMGNRATTVINGVTTQYVTNDMNEYTSVGGVTYTYDAGGNLVSDGIDTFKYNILNELIDTTSPTVTSTFAYNALGQRASTTVNGTSTSYLIDPQSAGSIVGAYNTPANFLHVVSGVGVAAVMSNANSYYYDFDANGSTADITSPIGSVVNAYVYDPFGGLIKSTASTLDPFTFIGQSSTAVPAGLIYLTPFRGFDPTIGRFLTPDPLRSLEPGSNQYSYSYNQPPDLTDASGLFATRQFVKGVGHYVAGSVIIVSAVAFGPEVAFGVVLVGGTYQIIGFGEATLAAFDKPFLFEPGKWAAEAWFPGNEGALLLGSTFDFASTAFLSPSEELSALTGLEGLFQAEDLFDYIDASEFIDELLLGETAGVFGELLSTLGSEVGDWISAIAKVIDPNRLTGPAGFGSSRFISGEGVQLPYLIQFENSPTATAPAQSVTITDQLDPTLDWTAFQLTGIAWGDTILTIPPDSQHYDTTVSMTYNGQTFDVLVDAGIHTDTGQVYATFQSLDPKTQLPPDALTGFLPPEDGTGRGSGYVSFMIAPDTGLPTGTQIRNVALITFDQNPAVATDQVDDDDPTKGIDPNKQALVTIDAGAPTSDVAALPATESTVNFPVSWSGQDDTGGAGVGWYDVYVSDNGGPFTIWQSHTAETSATFSGINGHTYAVYSVATDNVGNVQPAPAAAEATTTINAPVVSSTTSIQATENPAMPGDSVTFTATVAPGDSTDGTPTGTIQFEVDGTNYGSPIPLTDGEAAFIDTALGLGNHAITAIYASDNGIFAPSTGAVAGGESIQTNVNVLLSSSAPESSYGQALIYTASVSALTSGLPAPSGIVQFEIDEVPFGAPVSVVNGQAQSPSITTILAGTHTISALYSNDPDYSSNSATTPQTVNKVDLTVTAGPSYSIYGSAPILTYTITGFVNGETASVVAGSPSLSTTATSTSDVGSYPISIALGTLSAANYDFPTLIGGTLNVNPAPLTMTANPESITYGSAIPALTYTITGFVNGQTTSVVSGSPVLTTAATSSSDVGSYPITIAKGTLSAPNYDFTNLIDGTFQVTKAPLTIRASDETRVQGDNNPTFTASYSGFVNGDGPSSLTSSPAFATSATNGSPPGTYSITVGRATSPNYAITFIGATLTVTPAPLVTVTGVQPLTNKRHQITEIIVSFSGGLNATEADSIGTYRLATPGKKGSFTARNAKAIKLKSALYTSAGNTVTLTPRKPFIPTKPVQLLIHGSGSSGLDDTFGRLIDGNDDGRAGGDAIAILRRRSVRLDQVARTAVGTAHSIHPSAVDKLLEQEDTTGSKLLPIRPAARR